MIGILITVILIALRLYIVRQLGLPPELVRVIEVVTVVLVIIWLVTRLFGVPLGL
jgi:hypothetical protein